MNSTGSMVPMRPLFTSLLVLALSPFLRAETQSADVIIYGGTSAAVIAAV
ncbi:MAG: hypothetical protein ACJA2W_002132, partial [Planctomycetota bacterium]